MPNVNLGASLTPVWQRAIACQLVLFILYGLSLDILNLLRLHGTAGGIPKPEPQRGIRRARLGRWSKLQMAGWQMEAPVEGCRDLRSWDETAHC